VSLVNVRNGPVFYGELPALSAEEVDRSQRKAQKEMLDNAQARALALGLKLGSVEHAEGLPAQEIARVAGELGVDQVVLGTHGHGAMGSLFMGSVAQQVVHLVKVPVLLVR
jgi:nucleotide-binding universal stress UspA family protein